MKIDIVSGFLGAGKTTLIKKLLKGTLKNEKIAIIENEYGEVGIDGAILKEEAVEVKEITSGCICCSIRGDFKESISNIVKDYRPERIIIEPSGVAKFSQVLESIKEAKIDGSRINMKITVVDAQNVDMYLTNFGEFYENQLISASTILLSKTQFLSYEEIGQICNTIRKINKNCILVTTPWDSLTSERIIEVAERKVEELVEKEFKSSEKRSSIPLDNWGIETSKVFKEHEIKNILKSLEDNKEYGEIVRVKGIVNCVGNEWIKFDYVPNDTQIKKYSSDYTGRVCVIGLNLNKDKLNKIFLK